MPLTQRDRRALWVGGALVAAAVLYRLALQPAFDTWAQARAQVEAQRSLIDRVDAQVDRQNAIRQRLRDRYGPAIDKPLPTVEEARVAFSKSVQDAIGKRGAKPTSIEVQGVRRLREAPGVSLVTLRVNAMCNANAIPDLLNGLRTADQIVIVDSVDLSMKQPNNRNEWSVVLQLSTPAIEQAPRKEAS